MIRINGRYAIGTHSSNGWALVIWDKSLEYCLQQPGEKKQRIIKNTPGSGYIVCYGWHQNEWKELNK